MVSGSASLMLLLAVRGTLKNAMVIFDILFQF
jgi:hypothetical protein